MILTPKSN